MYFSVWKGEYLPLNSSKSSQKTLNYLFNEWHHDPYKIIIMNFKPTFTIRREGIVVPARVFISALCGQYFQRPL